MDRLCPVCGEAMQQKNAITGSDKGSWWCNSKDCWFLGMPPDYQTHADRLAAEVEKWKELERLKSEMAAVVAAENEKLRERSREDFAIMGKQAADVEKLNNQISQMHTLIDKYEAENAELLSQIDRYLIQARDDIECEARIGVNGELRFVIPPPTGDPAGVVLSNTDKFVKVHVHVVGASDGEH